MTYKEIANLAVTGQSLGILANTLPKKKKKKKKLVKTGVETIIGTSLLRVSAANVASL